MASLIYTSHKQMVITDGASENWQIHFLCNSFISSVVLVSVVVIVWIPYVTFLSNVGLFVLESAIPISHFTYMAFCCFHFSRLSSASAQIFHLVHVYPNIANSVIRISRFLFLFIHLYFRFFLLKLHLLTCCCVQMQASKRTIPMICNNMASDERLAH